MKKFDKKPPQEIEMQNIKPSIQLPLLALLPAQSAEAEIYHPRSEGENNEFVMRR